MVKKRIILSILVILLVLILLIIFYNYFFVLGVKNIEFTVKVAENVGLNADTDKLYFGAVPPGGVAERGILIKNEEYPLSKINLKINSNIKNWLYVDKTNFFLKKGEEGNINLKIKIPTDAQQGNYNGQIILIFTRF